MAYKPKVKTVAEGGTGISSDTAYAVVCGGTTSTGAFQSIASVGTSTHVLKSNGAGALPSFQAASSVTNGLIVWWAATNGTVISDSNTYYFADVFASNGTTAAGGGAGFASTRYYMPNNGTIKACYGVFTVGSLGTSEGVTLRIIINNSTNVDVSTTLDFSASPVSVSNGSLSQAVSAGDYLQLVWITPAFSTNPGSVKFSGSIYIELS